MLMSRSRFEKLEIDPMLKQQKVNKRLDKQQGLTLMELMVAITIFAIITVSVFSLFMNTSRTYHEDEKFARMQENGRFALNIIASDLNMVDFWGEMLTPEFINTGGVAFGTDCNIGLGTPNEALRYYDPNGTSSFNPTSCAANTVGDLKAGTSALAIKRVANAASTTVTDGLVYLRTNGFDGAFIDDAATVAATAEYSDWLYTASLYFIKEDGGVPYLCQATTNGGTAFTAIANAEDDCMAEGVEQLHVEFGIDTDTPGDGVANRYLSDIVDTDAKAVVTVRVYLLLRSKDAIAGNTNTKTYNLGNLTPITVNDGYYRRVYSTTVTLRNPMNSQRF